MLFAGRTSAVDGNNPYCTERGRREPKTWWKPASREQALSWVTLVAGILAAIAVGIAVPIASQRAAAAVTTNITAGYQMLPLDTFTSNLAGKAGSSGYAFVQLGAAAAVGRRRLAAGASGSSVFRIATSFSGLSSAAAALALTQANGTAAEISGNPYKIDRRSSGLLILSARPSDANFAWNTSAVISGGGCFADRAHLGRALVASFDVWICSSSEPPAERQLTVVSSHCPVLLRTLYLTADDLYVCNLVTGSVTLLPKAVGCGRPWLTANNGAAACCIPPDLYVGAWCCCCLGVRSDPWPSLAAAANVTSIRLCIHEGGFSSVLAPQQPFYFTVTLHLYYCIITRFVRSRLLGLSLLTRCVALTRSLTQLYLLNLCFNT